jgi:hypothetical protein
VSKKKKAAELIVYTVVSEPDSPMSDVRTERMSLHRDTPSCHSLLRDDRDIRPYRIAWRPYYGDRSNPWRKSCLGRSPGYFGPVIGDGSTEAALAWLLEGEER